MIAYIQGTLLSTREKSCIILTSSGLGYEVFLTSQGMSELPGRGVSVEFFISSVIREDSFDLYGFLTEEERTTFNVLLNTPKLGPKTALAILSIYSPDRLKTVIASEDERMLAQVPGIGIKSARRILIDLKDKLNFVAADQAAPKAPVYKGSVRQDVLAGLVSLGYTTGEITHIVEAVLENEPDLDVSAAIRAVLKKKAQE
ncbi:Holliday junction branch migration protein RuvA [Desulfonatronovibrio magnus]|uniref:Holliday junction branch migration protein RuvA n=1 Tax=Desulfonatronovibrio magnus TaxID=698827 RepID=UPI0005EAD7AF|nr:Holliday junction branch migration protein RuvA [Desulfonatronovibrio magnus]